LGTLTLYLDASALVPLFAVDVHVAGVKRAIAAASSAIAVSDFAAAEFASVIARRVRGGDLDQADARAAFAHFDQWVAALAVPLALLPADIAAAAAFLRRLDLALRAPDAMHLAITQRVGARLLTFDAKLAMAAHHLRVPVAPI
jgi:predicted nucleic acid-binding protein